jgi:UPF0176 protein
MAISFNKNSKPKVLSSCEHCGKKADDYFDCANLTCHRLFIACQTCKEDYQGLCKVELSRSKTLASPQIFLN